MVNNTRVYGPGQSLGGSMNRIENLYPSVQRPTSFKNHLRSSYPRIVENPVPASPQLPPMPSIELIHSDRPHLSGSLSSSSSINSGSFSSSDYYARIELPHEPSTVINEHYDQLARLRHIPSDQLKVMNRLARGCFGEVNYLSCTEIFGVMIRTKVRIKNFPRMKIFSIVLSIYFPSTYVFIWNRY